MYQNPFRVTRNHNQRNHSGFAQAAMSSLHQATPNGANKTANCGTAHAFATNNA